MSLFCFHFQRIFLLGVEFYILSVSTLKMSFHCLLAYIVSDERTIFILVLLNVMCFLLWLLLIFYLFFNFRRLTKMCLSGVFFVVFIQLRVQELLGSWVYVFHKFWKNFSSICSDFSPKLFSLCITCIACVSE